MKVQCKHAGVLLCDYWFKVKWTTLRTLMYEGFCEQSLIAAVLCALMQGSGEQTHAWYG